MNRLPLVRAIWVWLALFLAGYMPAYADSLPASAFIYGVEGHAQVYNLSCEARSAVDWMAFWGVSVPESDFLAQVPSAANPDLGFVGSPNDTWGNVPPLSYGMHAEPVAALIRQYGFQAHARRDLPWDDLRAEVAAGHPVIVWVIGQMWPGTPQVYTDAEDHNTIVASFEHTMILVGYDSTYVYVIDSFSGLQQTYGVQAFLSSWSVLGNMAVTGQRDGGEAEPAAPPLSRFAGDTYIVQRGDFLIALAERFGISWQELAEKNNIFYPYTIYPGQVLDVPGDADPTQSPPALAEPTATLDPAPTLVPTALPMALPPAMPTALPPVLKQRDIRYQLYLPGVCLDCQSKANLPPAKAVPRQRRVR